MKTFLAIVALALVATSLSAKPITISGRVLGSDGKPLRRANVAIMHFDTMVTLTSGNMRLPMNDVAADGSYSIVVDAPGYFVVGATGVDHEQGGMPIAFFDETDATLDFTLGTYEYANSFDSVRVIGEFNDWSFDSATVPMKRQPNGTYVANIPWKRATLAYQLIGVVPGHSVNGTMGTKWEYDGGGDWRSIIDVKRGKARIVFDPRKLPPAGEKFTMTTTDSKSHLARYIELEAWMQSQQDLWERNYRSWQETGKSAAEFKYDNSAALDAIANDIRTESDPITRQILLYKWIATRSSLPRDSVIAQIAAREIPPESLLWSLDRDRISDMYTFARKLPTPLTQDEYMERVSTKHPVREARAEMLYYRMALARYQHDTVGVNEIFSQLMRDHPTSFAAMRAQSDITRDRVMKIGNRLPEFSFASLNDSSVTYSNETLRGRFYLIDFWATWCGPCVGEMPSIHKAYEKYHSRNFDILSLSFDASPREIGAFTAKKWKMPWMHAFVEGGFDNPVSQRFGVTGIPMPILVGPGGTIVAIEEELRGEDLARTLERVLTN